MCTHTRGVRMHVVGEYVHLRGVCVHTCARVWCVMCARMAWSVCVRVCARSVYLCAYMGVCARVHICGVCVWCEVCVCTHVCCGECVCEGVWCVYACGGCVCVCALTHRSTHSQLFLLHFRLPQWSKQSPSGRVDSSQPLTRFSPGSLCPEGDPL